MDVDNLGAAFISGFEQLNAVKPEDKQKYVTISRTSSFSRQMSLFFKSYINPILSGEFKKRESLKVSVVYSGGDDVFRILERDGGVGGPGDVGSGEAAFFTDPSAAAV